MDDNKLKQQIQTELDAGLEQISVSTSKESLEYLIGWGIRVPERLLAFRNGDLLPKLRKYRLK